MNSLLDIQLKESMQKYLDTFFLSLQGDTGSLNSFISTLSGFNNLILSHHSKLQAETLIAVQGFVSILDNVALNVLELEKKTKNLGDQTLTDITKILDKKMSDLNLRDEQDIKSSNGTSSHFPAYIKPSHEWLLHNLHNPYPSKEVKKSIAHRSKCSLKDIDSWFIDARKRIGWNALRREQFSNKQEKMIAAATRFFQPSQCTFSDELSSSLESEADLDDAYFHKFTAMENAARSLYSGKFVDIPSLIPSFNLSHQGAPSRSSARLMNGDGRVKVKSFPQPINIEREPHTEVFSPPILAYPTPEPSPQRSSDSRPSTPVPISSPTAHTTQCRKRRRRSVEPCEEEDFTRNGKKLKSNALICVDSPEIIVSSVPSPVSAIDSLEDISGDPQTSEPDSCPARVILSSPAKRKRRLSDGDNRRPTKRPHHALAVPRLQAVSDPFPISGPFKDDPIDEWFYNNFSAERQLSTAFPTPATFDLHDLPVDVPLQVHYDISPFELDVALPQASVPVRDNMSPEGLSEACEVSKSSTPENLISNSLPDLNEVNAAEIPSADELSLPLDYEVPFTVEETISRDMLSNPLNQFINFDPVLQLPPPHFNWMQSSLDGSVNVAEPPTLFMTENPSISNFDSVIHKGSIVPLDQDAKYLRIQFLREELKLLESEIDP